MSEDINTITIVGRLTRDSELKYTNTGSPVCKLTIAVNRSRKDGEQWIEEASFFDISLWGRRGESLNQYLLKGTRIGVTGELRQDRWEQDGQTRSRVFIHANNIQLLESKKQDNHGNNNQGNNNNQRNNNSNCNNNYNPYNDNRFNDDIPI